MKKQLFKIALAAFCLLACFTALAACHHTYDMIDVKMPTCESDGYYILKCNDCGDTKKEITDKAFGHDWAYVTGQEADCTEKGYKMYMCGNCGESKKETIAAKGHKWKDAYVLEEATCTKDGSMRTICSVCGLSGSRKLEKGHSYGAWKITEEATDHSKGTRSRACKNCNKKQTETFYPDGTLYKNIKNKKNEVKELQQLLTDLGFLNDKVDGIFGSKTEKAVKNSQIAYNLSADGIAWPQTIRVLGTAWDAAFGEVDEPTEPGNFFAPFCTMMILENEEKYWDTCEVHSDIFMHAADDVNEDSSEETFLKAYIDAWQADLDRMYQIWLLNVSPEDQPMVINNKTMFKGYLNSQQILWNMQFGEDSVKALEMTNEMLMEQCYTLCGVIYPLMVEK